MHLEKPVRGNQERKCVRELEREHAHRQNARENISRGRSGRRKAHLVEGSECALSLRDC